MSGLETTVVVLLALWLGVLSVAMAAMIRQVSLLTLRLDRNDSGHSLDGLSVGSEAPEPVAALLPAASGLHHVLVVGADCPPCRQLVEELRGTELPAALVALVEGDPERAQALTAALPADVVTVTGPRAADAYASLDLQTTPFLFAIDGRTIVDKAVVRNAAHLRSLVDPRPAPDGAPPATLEVSHVH